MKSTPAVLCFGFVLTALASIIGASPSSSQEQQRIAAVVDETIVSTRELVERINLAIYLSGLPDNAETRRNLAPQVLRRSIDERLQRQEAERLGIEITPEEVATALERVARPSGLAVPQFLQLLEQRGVSRMLIEEQIRAELAWNQLVRRQVSSRVNVTDAQIDMEIASELSEGGDEVLLSEILLPVYAPEEEEQAMAEAGNLIEAIRGGADVAALAEQVSVAASAQQGGFVGWVPLTAMSPTIRQVVDGLQPGQIAPPLRTAAGVQILILQDRRTGAAPSSDPGARRIAQILIPVAGDAPQQTAEQVFARANGMRSQLANCATVVQAAEELNTPASGDLGWIRLNDLSPQLARVLEALPLETISEPIRSENGFHLVMVCAKGGEDAANDAQQREAVRRRLEQEQIQHLSNRLLRDLRKSAFIDVRLGR